MRLGSRREKRGDDAAMGTGDADREVTDVGGCSPDGSVRITTLKLSGMTHNSRADTRPHTQTHTRRSADTGKSTVT